MSGKLSRGPGVADGAGGKVFDVPLGALHGEVPKKLLSNILSAARGTPSAANLQPWMFYVVTSSKSRELISASALDALGRRRQNHRESALSSVPALVMACMDVIRAKCRFGERGADLFGPQDVAVASHNVRIAAWQAGIASCWIREVDFQALAEELCLAPRFQPQALLAFGFADVEGLERPPTLPAADFVRREGTDGTSRTGKA